MRRSLSILAAAAIAIAGSASFLPAQAATRAAPAVATQAASDSAIVQVHGRRYREARRGHYRPYRRLARRHYHQPYAYYPRPYYYGRPGVTVQFSFGGPSYGHGYRW